MIAILSHPQTFAALAGTWLPSMLLASLTDWIVGFAVMHEAFGRLQ